MERNISLRILIKHVNEDIITNNMGQFFEYITSIILTQPITPNHGYQERLHLSSATFFDYKINNGIWTIFNDNDHYIGYYYRSINGTSMIIFYFHHDLSWCFQTLNKEPDADTNFIPIWTVQESTIINTSPNSNLSYETNDFYISDDDIDDIDDIDNPCKDGDYGSESGIDGLCISEEEDSDDEI